MCQAAPARVTRIEGAMAWVDERGRERAVSLLGVEGIAVGDYVYHHAGIAIARIEPAEAVAILAVLEELDALIVAEMEGPKS